MKITRDYIYNLTKWVGEIDELECDGASRIVHLILHENHIPHKCMAGNVQWQGKLVHPHFWIETPEFIVDFKLTKWLGENAPNGVFRPSETVAEYEGHLASFSLQKSKILRDLFKNNKRAVAETF